MKERSKKIGIVMCGYVLRESPTLYYLCECLQEAGISVTIFMDSHEELDAKTYQNIGVSIVSPSGDKGVRPPSLPSQKGASTSPLRQCYRWGLNLLFSVLPKRMRFIFFSLFYLFLSPTREYAFFLRRLPWDDFNALILVEPEGLQVYHAAKIKLPFIYLSMELNNLSFEKKSPGERYLKLIERHYIPQARFAIIQDAFRECIFREDTQLSADYPIYHLPVSVRGRIYTEKSDYFRQKFHISPEKRIVLYAGSIAPWSDLHKLIQVIGTWDEKFVVVIHGGRIDQHYLAQLQTLAGTSTRIFFSTDWISYDEFDTVISSADIGISSYADYTLNTQLTLYASGKNAMYLKSGLPIITNNFEGMQIFFQQTGCGLEFEAYDQIGELLQTIESNYERYRRNAFRTFQEQYCFDTHFQKLIPHIRNIH